MVTREYESIFDIKFSKKDLGLIIFDIDDTLGENEGIISKRAVKYLKELRDEGYKIALISNCISKREIYLKEVLSTVKPTIITKSDKPNPSSMRKLLKGKNIKNENVYMVGDRVATDLYASYLAGIENRYLVKPYSEVFEGKRPGFIYRTFRTVENWVAKNTL